eukprot:PhM_4_TR9151/c0_g1_i1/m.38615
MLRRTFRTLQSMGFKRKQGPLAEGPPSVSQQGQLSNVASEYEKAHPMGGLEGLHDGIPKQYVTGDGRNTDRFIDERLLHNSTAGTEYEYANKDAPDFKTLLNESTNAEMIGTSLGLGGLVILTYIFFKCSMDPFDEGWSSHNAYGNASKERSLLGIMPAEHEHKKE